MEKYHIVALNGSDSANSVTFRLTYHTILELKKMFGNDYEVTEFVTNHRDLLLKSCIGCGNCFAYGECPLDSQDYMGFFKESLLVSDCVIFSSPVYAHAIPGTMKCVLDRLAYWGHLMSLSGKVGFIIINTSESGAIETGDYLYKMMTYMGVDVRCIYRIAGRDRKKRPVIDEVAKKLARDIYSKINIKKKASNEDLSKVFKLIKEQYTPYVLNNIDQFEVNYWRRRRLDKIGTYEEYLDSLK